MHAGFISLKTKDAMVRSLENLLGPGVKSEDVNESPKKTNELSDADVAFIRTHCIEAVKAKWTDKAQIRSENIAVPVFDEKVDDVE